MGHSGAVYLKDPLIAATNIFEMRDTMPESQKDKQMAPNLLTSFMGAGSQRTATAEIQASPSAPCRSVQRCWSGH